jgi:valyl-tRNA synthetase
MGLPQRYTPALAEARWQETWAREQTYAFTADARPIFAIDTPPPTVSGDLHIGHVYSYIQAEAMARFWRMQGMNVYYPFGFDDNGLPTERYVEKRKRLRARDIGRAAFVAECLAVSHEVEDRFETFWKTLGFSVDWRLRYSTIDPHSQRIAQWSFLDLYQRGQIYRDQSPNLWCIDCQTAIAQADIDGFDRMTTFYTLAFQRAEQPEVLPVATTRPEFLPACVALFVHPDDQRFAHLVGHTAQIPLFGRHVPILADRLVNPALGTGIVMCCTFGDQTDLTWWRNHNLPLIRLLTKHGRLSAAAGTYADLTLTEARQRIVADLEQAGALLGSSQRSQLVRVHDRCHQPIEIIETSQWFIRLLDKKAALLQAGRQIAWHPEHMRTRYEHWVENLSWDWSISRQRFHGVPFPAWHCRRCGTVLLADQTQLPVDPTTSQPLTTCGCAAPDLHPDEDVMDTWMVSSLSPQIAAERWALLEPAAPKLTLPFQLRPQAHDIIRTWAFYTIAKAHMHHQELPWSTIMISGHALAPNGEAIHKSLGNAPIAPEKLIERYGADAVRYWACRGTLGADQAVHEATMKQGVRLINKLWNAARLIADHQPIATAAGNAATFVTDQALLSWLQHLIQQATEQFQRYDYAAALETTERFFWHVFCDNYLELIKGRMYDGTPTEQQAASTTLRATLLALLKLFAPMMPHVTEEIYQTLYAKAETAFGSLHTTLWPTPDAALINAPAEHYAELFFAIAGHVRRYKSERKQSLGTPLAELSIASPDPALRSALEHAALDLRSVTRATTLTVLAELAADFDEILPGLWLRVRA